MMNNKKNSKKHIQTARARYSKTSSNSNFVEKTNNSNIILEGIVIGAATYAIGSFIYEILKREEEDFSDFYEYAKSKK